MRRSPSPILLTVLAPVVAVAVMPGSGSAPRVAIVSVPDGGIQPQAAIDTTGTIHLLYFKGTPSAGDLYYVRQDKGEKGFSAPIRVNSEEGSALATGSVRGGQLAIGRGGRVHAAWHASAPKDQVFYTRSSDDGSRFERERNVTTWTSGPDGATVAADGRGGVYVAWHASGTAPGEAQRTVFVARSDDEGRGFAREEAATPAPIGACGCCGLRALAAEDGTLHLLYRAATADVHRDAIWLMMPRGQPPRTPVRLQEWELRACPMSTFALARGGNDVFAAWETDHQIFYAALDPRNGTFATPVRVGGRGSERHPAIAVNADGERLIAWTEGTAWARGGTLSWEVRDREDRRIASASAAGDVPVWGLVSAVARPDGSFVIFH
jgi:hypothetical protein